MGADTAAELKAQLRSLMDKRSAIEREISARTARLEATGVGMSASLVDAEGYPRADIDLAAIRADRHTVIVLSNDHKALTTEIEKLLHALHSQSRDEGNAPAAASAARPAAPAATAAPAAPAAAPGPAAASPPFALVDEVSPGSPAAAAGLRVGDMLLGLGDATAASGGMAAVAEVVRASQGRPVRAVVLRAGAPLELQLVPGPWGGRGLLGCHLQPVVR